MCIIFLLRFLNSTQTHQSQASEMCDVWQSPWVTSPGASEEGT